MCRWAVMNHAALEETNMRIRTTVSILLAAATAACAAPGGAPDTATQSESAEAQTAGVSLRLTQASGRSASLHYALTNHSSQVVHVLRWKTPLENASDKLFTVRKGDREIPYKGAFGKRVAPPTGDDYVALEPGAELSAEVDLSKTYDLSQGGTFKVNCIVPAQTLVSEADTVPVDVDTSVTIEVDETEESTSHDDLGSSEQAITFSGCSTSMKNTLNGVRALAGVLAGNGLSAFRANPWSVRAQRWFNNPFYAGATVDWFLEHIAIRLAVENYQFICDNGHPSCNGFLARAQGTNTVRICAGFWGLPSSGQDSKAGTLLHELSHFDGTGDFAYGPQASYDLAVWDPWTAASNADNYEYFYEDVIFP
jgi:peptidyl-Lys metalloendopeptidase